MFNVGGPEIVLVILVALVVLGPEQLPKAMRTFGNVMGEVRKLSSGFQSEMREAMNAVELDGLTKNGANKTSNGNTTGTASNGAVTDGVEEVVARNTGVAPAPTPAPGDSGQDLTPGGDAEPGSGSGGPSAADRAAG